MTQICTFFVSNMLSDSDMVRLESTRLSTTTNICVKCRVTHQGNIVSESRFCHAVI